MWGRGEGGEEKERKTKVEVDAQCEWGLEGEGTVRGGGAKLGCVEVTYHIYRLQIEVGKDAVGEEEATT